MLWPEDWDKPSDGNKVLCARFASGIWHGDNDISFKYRYFRPTVKSGQNSEAEFPLVLHLHGADAFGDDNEMQIEMHDIGTMFAKDEWQDKHPCYILIPQCDQYTHWSRSDVTKEVQRLVESFADRYKEIDKSRIYVYGYSAGGLGTFNLIKKFPNYYAGAIPICGATNGDGLQEMLKTPIWMIHAIDDRIVKASYGNPGEGSKFYMGSHDLYDVAQKYVNVNTDFRYTEYPQGWMKKLFGVNPHCSWVAVSDDKFGAEIREWLFKQKRKIK